MHPSIDLADTQGLLRFAYKHHTEAAFVLLRVKNPDAARAWLAGARPADAVAVNELPSTVLQIALGADGLRALQVPDAIVEDFSPEFVAGLGTDLDRARRLGDAGVSHPSTWQWGRPGRVPHVLALLYALPGSLASFQRGLMAQWAECFDVLQVLPTGNLDGAEPFGFADGVSQPMIDWSRSRPAEDHDQLAYTNLNCLGEFVLGYPNEYGRYTVRPLLDAGAAPSLPYAEDAPSRADLGRHGSYLVLRTLRQDVRGFWRFVDDRAQGDAAARQHLAAQMVGRTMTGEPLADARDGGIPGVGSDPADIAANGFTYSDDPVGLRCPRGAHVRRSNPRNADLPAGVTGLVSRAVRVLGFNADGLRSDLVASSRFHRLLRRGREYGSALPVQAALVSADPTPSDETGGSSSADDDRGLHFIALCADIARQFEFVQGAWLMGSKFDGLPHEADPLLGNRLARPGEGPTDVFSLPQPIGPDRQVCGLPSFVTVTGGGYFFLPGLRALRYLATVGGSSAKTSSPVGS